MIRPDYHGGSIVNLMSSLIVALGGAPPRYPPLRALPPEALGDVENVVLFVIDGLGHDFLLEAGRDGVLCGHLAARIDTVFPPTTATAVTTFLTGDAPQQHGLTGWFTYFRELGTILSVLPFTARCGAEPLGRAGVSASRLFGHVPVFDRIAVSSHIVTPAWIAHSDFNLAHRGRASVSPYADLSQCFALLGGLVRLPGRKYIYAYWPGLDALGHERGIGSPEAVAHLGEIDRAFEQLLGEIRGSSTLILVTADHGIVDTDPAQAIDLARHPALARRLVLPLCGERRFAYCYVRTGCDADFERCVSTELGDAVRVYRGAELIERGCFGLGAPHARLHERVGDYALAPTGAFTLGDRLPGERPLAHIGAHGGTSERELHVPLVILRA